MGANAQVADRAGDARSEPVATVRSSLIERSTAADVADVFRVLSDPTRVSIIHALSLGELRTQAGALRAATNRPFNLNFFAHDPPKENAGVDALTRKRLKPFYQELGLGEVPTAVELPFGTFTADTLAALLGIEPAVVS
ncbi:MAG: hypothetical protein IIB88_11235, partial [Chloroflexi bacterium]|nr:hypothetical protein [Chloroflexota bacterium]